MSARVRDDLREAQPYGAPVIDVPILLNVNENPFPPPAAVVDRMKSAVAEALSSANRYPDRECTRLREELAGFVGGTVTASNVWPANGSNEVMHQILTAFAGPGGRALSFAPTYSMYPQYARDTFTEYVTAPRASDFTLDLAVARRAVADHRPYVVVVASPNNPTGTPLPDDDLAGLIRIVEDHDALLVVDEAYVEFADPDLPSAARLVGQRENLVVTRTMSKAFGLAGLRVGYAIANPDVIDALRIVRLPYHLSATTQAMAVVAVRESAQLLAPIPGLRSERDAQGAWLTGMGIAVAPSQANFLLIGRFADRDLVWRRLLERGVLVRATGPDGWLRVSIGSPAENAAFREAFSLILQRGLVELVGGAA